MAETGRTFTPEFKAEAVKLVTDHSKSLAEVTRDLDLGESMLRAWKVTLAQGGENAFPGRGNPPALEEELRRLRAEVKRLTMERDILPLNASIAWSSFSADFSANVVLMRART